ncbi:hypothetical protein CANARDRAFT_28860 [[Candida] arabinofermentans NRRL YB-2248]|uniref:N-acetyltransferase domain-containing protein n=1 Tax=[Candida] arabinofermentans NRRL YB-2248 TaxID=983967 RepID=A0A1E4SZ21_9ASCO|nr:hypothetical protein CANARDRAFT_28860 [[Candida] arabinofermentans NRRL YB-2248]
MSFFNKFQNSLKNSNNKKRIMFDSNHRDDDNNDKDNDNDNDNDSSSSPSTAGDDDDDDHIITSSRHRRTSRTTSHTGSSSRKIIANSNTVNTNQNTNTNTNQNTNNSLHVEVVNIKDYKKAAKTLQIAFKDDLYVNYLTSGIKDQSLKEQMDLALFEGSVYSTILSGLVVAIKDHELELTDPDAPFLAVACFEKPKKNDTNDNHNESTENNNNGGGGGAGNQSIFKYLWSMYQGGYLKFLWMANKETRTRVFEEQSSMLNQFRLDVLGDDYDKAWYLSDLGAIPRGRGKGLARRLIDYVCHNYIDVYKFPSTKKSNVNDDDDDDDDDEIDGLNEDGFTIDDHSKTYTNNNNDQSLIDSEIQSYNFEFDLQSDTFTDYSGYSSDSDNSSAHSSWYYNEEQDILAQYDNFKNKGKEIGAPLYLESSHPRNRKIYQKLGFTYVETVNVANVLDNDGDSKVLTMDLMVRGVKGAKWYKKEDARMF